MLLLLLLIYLFLAQLRTFALVSWAAVVVVDGSGGLRATRPESETREIIVK